jgi:translation initiation factor IF-1
LSKDDSIQEEGIVHASKGNGHFIVRLPSGTDIKCTIAGKMNKHNIRILEGDRVKVEIGVYDLTRGRITYRIK